MSKKRFVFKKVISYGMFECSYKNYRVRIDTNGPSYGWIIMCGNRPIASTRTTKLSSIDKMSDEYVSSVIKQMVIGAASEAHFYAEQVRHMVDASNVLTKGL